MNTTNTLATKPETRDDDHFEQLSSTVRRRVAAAGKGPLFKARIDGDLFATYLDGFAPEDRQHHNCHACRRFIERYGAVVAIRADGSSLPLCWDAEIGPGHYAASIRALARVVTRAPIEGVFLDEATIWGSGPTPDAKRGVTWTHFTVQSPSPFKHPLHTSGQAMASKREEYGMLMRGLAEFPAPIVEQARALLETDSLYRSEKCLGVAKWLLDLHGRLMSVKNERLRENLVWMAVATAPAGFCHVRSSMIGTLLEDIAAGLPFEAVKNRFAEKMHPLQYQRPQAPPSDGNLAQAEKLVEALRAAGALERRFAKLVDIQPLWIPTAERPAEPAPPPGVFSHLMPNGARKSAPANLAAPAVVMTWVKFAREVLPRAERIEYLVPSRGNFAAFVTAANPDAPPILQWDAEGRRNRVSWYLYTGGSLATNWNLPACEPRRVTAIALQPPQWHDPDKFAHHGSGVLFVLDGARDTGYTSGGGFFPESLRAEYHAVRRTMEAYAQRATIAGLLEAEACGVLVQKGGGWNGGHVVFVTTRGTRIQYCLDRWD